MAVEGFTQEDADRVKAAEAELASALEALQIATRGVIRANKAASALLDPHFSGKGDIDRAPSEVQSLANQDVATYAGVQVVVDSLIEEFKLPKD